MTDIAGELIVHFAEKLDAQTALGIAVTYRRSLSATLTVIAAKASDKAEELRKTAQRQQDEILRMAKAQMQAAAFGGGIGLSNAFGRGRRFGKSARQKAEAAYAQFQAQQQQAQSQDRGRARSLADVLRSLEGLKGKKQFREWKETE